MGPEIPFLFFLALNSASRFVPFRGHFYSPFYGPPSLPTQPLCGILCTFFVADSTTIPCSVFYFVKLNNPIPIIFTFYQLSTRFSAPFEYFEFARAQSFNETTRLEDPRAVRTPASRSIGSFRATVNNADDDEARCSMKIFLSIVSMLIFCFTSFLLDSVCPSFCLCLSLPRDTNE